MRELKQVLTESPSLPEVSGLPTREGMRSRKEVTN